MGAIVVKYIGGIKPRPYTEPWGGTVATNDAYLKAFNNDTEFIIDAKFRHQLKTVDEIKDFIAGGDILHIDDTTVVEMVLNAGILPDVIGPIARSPLKQYKGWTCPYKAIDFYKAKIIRLNYAEEADNHELVTLIRHGTDSKMLRPSTLNKKYILWAGDGQRYAKNYEMWQEIKKITTLPQGYEWKELTKYSVQDYWNVLNETALLINTSRFESFCAAMAEARCKEVPVIYKKDLHGQVQQDGKIQVEYEPFYYKLVIEGLLNNPPKLLEEGKASRQYIIKNHSLKAMRDDIAKVYMEVINEKLR